MSLLCFILGCQIVLAPTTYQVKDACPDVECWIEVYAEQYGVDVEVAKRIAFAESSYREKAVNHNTNGSNDMGVYQINSIHNVPDTCRLDAKCNIEWAMDYMSKNGFNAWYPSYEKWK